MNSGYRFLALVACAWLLAITASECSAQRDSDKAADTRQASALSDDWLGTWSGQVTATSAAGPEKTFRMQLMIEPTNDPAQLKWTLIHDDPQGKSTRKNLLLDNGSRPGEFILDEQNGIRIHAVLLDNSLSSTFTRQEQRIWSTYRLQSSSAGWQIHFEQFSVPEASAMQSGGQAGMPQVTSWKPAIRQAAVLKQTTAPTTATATASADLPAWRKLKTEPYRGKQDDIFFVDENRGWYGNGAGKIFRTLDGGTTWTQQLDQPGTFFRCIAFLDAEHGFAGNVGPDYFPGVSDSVPLYETLDGGVTWNAVTTIEGEPVVGLCALQIMREEFIHAGNLETRTRMIGVGRVGGPTTLIVSDDLGKTWQQIDISQHAAMALDVHFFNRNEGFIAAASSQDVTESHALILATNDGGETWTKAWQSERPYELTWKMSFPTRDVGYVTIQSYNPDPTVTERFVAKTIDGGQTWMEIPLVDDAKVREFGVAFLDRNTGWVGAMPNGFQTTDGGKTWQTVEMGNAVNKIRLLKTDSKQVGYAIGVNVHRIDIPRQEPGTPTR
jgi:photosystem II stability/assembly factor-like uncharacterized protein